jgi:hypothetical protein
MAIPTALTVYAPKLYPWGERKDGGKAEARFAETAMSAFRVRRGKAALSSG